LSVIPQCLEATVVHVMIWQVTSSSEDFHIQLPYICQYTDA